MLGNFQETGRHKPEFPSTPASVYEMDAIGYRMDFRRMLPRTKSNNARSAAYNFIKEMISPGRDKFEDIVEWAYTTLPQEIRDLPDFPGIQVVDEPPAEMFDSMAKRRNWSRRTELLGSYSGVPRTQRQFNLVQTSPDLIFVFRGPILRCSKGDLPGEIKEVVWHEVAHWLGHDEEEVRKLGLSSRSHPNG